MSQKHRKTDQASYPLRPSENHSRFLRVSFTLSPQAVPSGLRRQCERNTKETRTSMGFWKQFRLEPWWASKLIRIDTTSRLVNNLIDCRGSPCLRSRLNSNTIWVIVEVHHVWGLETWTSDMMAESRNSRPRWSELRSSRRFIKDVSCFLSGCLVGWLVG